MTTPIPDDVRALLDAPNYLHLSTLRADGSPRNWVVWVGLEGDHILVSTYDVPGKSSDMRRDPRVGLSIIDSANPYRVAVMQGRVIEIRPDDDYHYTDPISIKYIGSSYPDRGVLITGDGQRISANRLCFVIALETASHRIYA